ncbi:MAG: hypothetical protein WDM90_00060 [Ferruginibacter sp.]
MQTHDFSYKDAIKQIEEGQKNIATNWQAYLLTYLTPEEEQLTKTSCSLNEHIP